LTKEVVEKNLPFIKSKVYEITPTVMDSVLEAVKIRDFAVRNLLDQIASRELKKVAFYSALGAVGILTAFAIVREKTKG
jgi:hypothetical protein